jgi:hypothetical protein
METEKSSQNVIDAIKSGKAKMRPRWFFIWRTVLIIGVTAVVLLLLLYVTSFIIFALHQNGAWFGLYFGLSGWAVFLKALPWGLLLLSFALLVLLANLLKRYAFIYHQPLFYFLFAFIVLVILGSFLIAATSFQPGFTRYAAENIPMMGSFYQFEMASPATIHRGEIVAFIGTGFIIENSLGITSTVVVAPGVGFSSFHLGDTVLVYGSRQADGIIEAFGVEQVVE